PRFRARDLPDALLPARLRAVTVPRPVARRLALGAAGGDGAARRAGRADVAVERRTGGRGRGPGRDALAGAVGWLKRLRVSARGAEGVDAGVGGRGILLRDLPVQPAGDSAD